MRNSKKRNPVRKSKLRNPKNFSLCIIRDRYHTVMLKILHAPYNIFKAQFFGDRIVTGTSNPPQSYRGVIIAYGIRPTCQRIFFCITMRYLKTLIDVDLFTATTVIISTKKMSPTLCNITKSNLIDVKFASHGSHCHKVIEVYHNIFSDDNVSSQLFLNND